MTSPAGDPPCPFCAYADGTDEPDGGLIHQTTTAIAFTPRRPFTPGHTLVCPRAHTDSLLTAEPGVVTDVMLLAQRVVSRYFQANVITSIGPDATQTVAHWHVHVVPRHHKDGLGGWPWQAPRSSDVMPGRVQIHIDHRPPAGGGYGPGHLQEAFELGRRSR
jgi:histidine triad (HIT) family protein